ncbi:hypothetical protein OO184_18510 [Photorhabdus sp. APURE]|uniref:hypothetical protein n=1 Tax=Photorhabdus aballayi TaxID=2991723 RepID=UPI00223E456A|nr:hypothetical protein [Photorhabdus aballayi]MCW7549872.1 hypothetical protein [Photorhabdus aballayi]
MDKRSDDVKRLINILTPAQKLKLASVFSFRQWLYEKISVAILSPLTTRNKKATHYEVA